MGTPCMIGYCDKETGMVKAIYCHFDGYPDGVGKMLKEHYQDENKVKELIALGDISFLEREVNPPDGIMHSFEKPCAGVTVAYHRDRGEDLNYRTFDSITDFNTCCFGNRHAYCPFGYIYADGTWAH